MNKLITGYDLPKDLMAILRKYGLPDHVISFRAECGGPGHLLEITATFYGQKHDAAERGEISFEEAKETRTFLVVDKDAPDIGGQSTFYAHLRDLIITANQLGLPDTAMLIELLANSCREEIRTIRTQS